MEETRLPVLYQQVNSPNPDILRVRKGSDRRQWSVALVRPSGKGCPTASLAAMEFQLLDSFYLAR